MCAEIAVETASTDRAQRPSATALGFWAVTGTLIFFAFNVTRPFGIYDEGLEYLLSRARAMGEPLFETFQLIYPLSHCVSLALAIGPRHAHGI